MPEIIDFANIQNQDDAIDFAALPPERTDGNFAAVASESMARRVADNLNPVNLPGMVGNVAGDVLAGAAAAVRTPFSDNTLGENFDLARNSFPANVLRSGPHVDSFDIQAGLTSAGGFLADATPNDSSILGMQMSLMRDRATEQSAKTNRSFAESRDDAVSGALERFESNPTAAAGGQVLGDAASLVAGRAPFVNAAKNTRLAAAGKPPVVAKAQPPSVKRFFDRKFGETVSSFKQGGKTIAESGFEGALIAAANDEDPLSAAALGAGSQLTANLARIPWDSLPTKSKTLKVAALAAGTAALVQLVNSFAPGGEDNFFAAEESAYNKVAFLMVAGVMTNAAGFNRPSTQSLDELGIFADSFNSIRRGAALSFMSDAVNNDENNLIMPVLNKLTEDPESFTPTEQRRLERAMLDENVSMSETIKSLMNTDPSFRRKISGLGEAIE